MKARDNKNMTILHRAVESGNFELVKWLVVEQKVDVNAKDTYRDTAWDKAAERGNLELLKWYIDRTLSPVDLESLLVRAAKTSEFKYHSGCYDVIKWLVEAIEEIEVPVPHTGPRWSLLHPCFRRGTLLQAAVYGGNYEVVKWLIDSRRVSGLEVNERMPEENNRSLEVNKSMPEDNNRLLNDVHDRPFVRSEGEAPSWTALNYAAWAADADMVELLAPFGELNGANNYGWTPLHFAAGSPRVWNVIVIEFLVEKTKLDVNCTTSVRKFTPLHIGARTGHDEIVEFLMGKGADVNLETSDGWTAKDIALMRGKMDQAVSLAQR
jgi:Ankyrin repeats (many copies)/Ankyrin repeats (3 copies)/Ankyrin repeat